MGVATLRLWWVAAPLLVALVLIIGDASGHRHRGDPIRRLLCGTANPNCRLSSSSCRTFLREALETNNNTGTIEIYSSLQDYQDNFLSCASELGLNVTLKDIRGCGRGDGRGNGRGDGRGGGRGGKRIRRHHGPFGFQSNLDFLLLGNYAQIETYFLSLNSTTGSDFRKCFLRRNGFTSGNDTVNTERLEVLANATLSGSGVLEDVLTNIRGTACVLGTTFEVFVYMRCILAPCIM